MTLPFEEQTGALKLANTQLETRRAFIEAVLSSVTAGVIALDSQELNPAHQPLAEPPVAGSQEHLKAQALAKISPDWTNSCVATKAEPA